MVINAQHYDSTEIHCTVHIYSSYILYYVNLLFKKRFKMKFPFNIFTSINFTSAFLPFTLAGCLFHVENHF